MLYVLLFFALFLPALGNAMNRRVYRRAVAVAAGKTTLPERSKAYTWTARSLFTIGLVLLGAWIAYFILMRVGVLPRI